MLESGSFLENNVARTTTTLHNSERCPRDLMLFKATLNVEDDNLSGLL